MLARRGTMVNQRSNGDVNTTTLTPEDSFRDGFANHRIVSTYPWEESCKQAPERLWECMRIVGIQWFTLCFVISFQKRASHGPWYRSQLQCTWPLCFRYQAISAASCALGPAPKLLFPAWYPIPIFLPEWPCKRTYTRNGRGCVFQTYTVFDLNHRWTTSTQELYSFSQVSLVFYNCTHWAFWKLKQQNKIKRICCVSAQESKCVWLGNRTSSAHIAIFV